MDGQNNTKGIKAPAAVKAGPVSGDHAPQDGARLSDPLAFRLGLDSEKDVDTVHEEIAAKLPWFVSGRLSAEERQAVAQHLEWCPRCAAELALERRLNGEGLAKVDEELLPVRYEIDTVLARVEQLEGELKRSNARIGGILRNAANAAAGAGHKLLMSPLPVLRVAVAAAVIVVLIQVVTVVGGYSGLSESGFQTASARYGLTPEASEPATRLLVQFSDEAATGDVRQLLEELEGQIVGGPSIDGLFEVSFSGDLAQPENNIKLIDRLLARSDLVRFAGAAQ